MFESGSDADLDYSYRTFNLREGDLEANRTGYLSPRQKKRLMLSFVLELIVALPLGAVLIGVMIGLSSMDVDPGKKWVVWVTDAILSGMILFMVYWFVQRARDLFPGTVAEFTGRVYTEEHETTIDDPNADVLDNLLGTTAVPVTIFSVFLGTQKFRVSEKTYNFFYRGKRGKAKPSFRVYYLPHTRRILSAEKIADEPDSAPKTNLPPL